MIQTFLFYTLAIILVGSVVVTISSRNSIRSSLFLLLAILNVSGLLVLLGAEVIAVTLILVTMFTIAVLFLCGVLMLDINFVQIHRAFKQHFRLASIIGLSFVAELLVFSIMLFLFDSSPIAIISEKKSSISMLGPTLYMNYFYIIQACGLILLVSVIGVVILTSRKKDSNDKSQDQRKSQQLEPAVGSTRADEVGSC